MTALFFCFHCIRKCLLAPSAHALVAALAESHSSEISEKVGRGDRICLRAMSSEGVTVTGAEESPTGTAQAKLRHLRRKNPNSPQLEGVPGVRVVRRLRAGRELAAFGSQCRDQWGRLFLAV